MPSASRVRPVPASDQGRTARGIGYLSRASGCRCAPTSGTSSRRSPMNRARRAVTALAALVLGASLVSAPVASAEPATTVRYPKPATTTTLVGHAFDTCTAPALDKMRAWRSSPYRGVGVYIGGPNRTCAQPELTADWVTEVSHMPWRIIPIYMGLQAPCTIRGAGSVNIDPARPRKQGSASAADAIKQAKAVGILPGSAIYGDMEHYDADNARCRTTVLRYLSAWTNTLHRNGYLSGVYAHLYSGAKHLSEAYYSTRHARPDALWIARWDGDSSLLDWQDIPNNQWARGQRGKQYQGDHNETHGGVTMNIDSDRFHAPVATVSRLPGDQFVTAQRPQRAVEPVPDPSLLSDTPRQITGLAPSG
ncbi:MAG: DUF1906 domain-containing protein [Actinophytocola sp.]|nr:DUF1906 domain-containing protein [Actinophytocola sp.]